MLVENGIFGFIAYLSLWFLLIFNLWRKYSADKSDSNLLLLTVALGLMLHSMIDFDLTYPVVYFIFWILIAIASEKLNPYQGLINQGRIILFAVPLVFLLIINTSLLVGWSYGQDGIRLMAQNNLQEAIERLEASTFFDPVNPTYLTNLSQLYLAKGINDNSQEYKDKALETINKSIKYNPTNFEWYIVKTRFLVELGRYEEAYQLALQAIRCAPFEEVVYYDTARFFIEAPNNKGIPYAEKIINLAQEEGKSIKENPHEKRWAGVKLFSSNKLTFLQGKIHFINKDYELSKAKFAKIRDDKDLMKEAKKYLQKSYELTGNYIGNGSFLNGDMEGWNLYGNGGNSRQLVYQDGVYWMRISKDKVETKDWSFYQIIHEFQPGQEYNVSFEAISKLENGETLLVIHQVGEDGHYPHKSKKFSIGQEIQKYSWSFKTDNLSNKQSLSIYFLVPNKAVEQDLYITNIKMSKVE